MGLQVSLGLQQQLVVLVVLLPLGLHLSPLEPSIIINGNYTNDQPCLYDVLGLFKSASGHGTFKYFMVLALGYVLITFRFSPSPLKIFSFSRSSQNLSQKNDDLGRIHRWITVKS